jgi:hypothetical protein
MAARETQRAMAQRFGRFNPVLRRGAGQFPAAGAFGFVAGEDAERRQAK